MYVIVRQTQRQVYHNLLSYMETVLKHQSTMNMVDALILPNRFQLKFHLRNLLRLYPTERYNIDLTANSIEDQTR